MGIWGLIALVVSVAATAAGYIQAKKAKKRAQRQSDAMAAQVSGHDSDRPLYVPYGKVLIGSTVIWKALAKNTPTVDASRSSRTLGLNNTYNDTKKRNVWLHRAVSLCEGPIQSVENVIIDGRKYTESVFSKDSFGHFRTVYSLGTDAGEDMSEIRAAGGVYAQWGSDKLGRGVAWAMERLGQDKDHPAYQGEPETQYVIKGLALYDPRLDDTVTGGSGDHRQDDSTTWEYSNNPALCLLDYLTNTRYGRGLAYADIDVSSFMAGADSCDETVTIPAPLTNTTGSSGNYYLPWAGGFTVPNLDRIPTYRPDQGDSETSVPRLTCNIPLDTGKEVLENVQLLLDAMRGTLPYVNGKYTLKIEEAETSVMSLNEDDIVGNLSVSGGDHSQRINRATIKFLNGSAKNFKPDQASWPKLDSDQYSTYLTEDQNEVLHRTFDIPSITDFYQAEDMAEVLVRDSRNTLTVSGEFQPRALRLVPGDVIDLTDSELSYSAKKFRVSTVSMNLDTLMVSLTLRAYDESVYTWSTKTNEPFSNGGDLGDPNELPAAPTIGTPVVNVETNADGSTIMTAELPWTSLEDGVDQIVGILNEQGTDTKDQLVIDNPDTAGSLIFQLPKDDTTYEYEVYVRDQRADGIAIASTSTTGSFSSGTVTGTRLSEVTIGADVGTDLRDEAGSVLSDIDLRNDLIQTKGLNSLTFNPSFEMSRLKTGTGTGAGTRLVPAGWYQSYSSGEHLRYLDDDERQTIRLQGATSVQCVSGAIRVEPGTQYELVALMRFQSGTASGRLQAKEFDTDLLPTGKRAIGFADTDNEAEVQDSTRSVNVAQTDSIGTTFTLVSGTYTPTSTCKWFSMSVDALNDVAGQHCEVEYAVARTLSTKNVEVLSYEYFKKSDTQTLPYSSSFTDVDGFVSEAGDADLTLVSGSEIEFDTAGTYKIEVTLVCDKESAGTKEGLFWGKLQLKPDGGTYADEYGPIPGNIVDVESGSTEDAGSVHFVHVFVAGENDRIKLQGRSRATGPDPDENEAIANANTTIHITRLNTV